MKNHYTSAAGVSFSKEFCLLTSIKLWTGKLISNIWPKTTALNFCSNLNFCLSFSNFSNCNYMAVYFSQKIGVDISCTLTPKEAICIGDNLHEISNPIFCEKLENKIKKKCLLNIFLACYAFT